MRVSFIHAEEPIEARRGDVVVCIPLYGGHEHFVACLHSVLEHTPVDVRIVVCDDASPDPRSREHVETLARQEPTRPEHHVLYLRRELNVGFPANVNGAFASTAPADVVVLNSDCIVAEGWLEGLREAAYADDGTASATALTNHGTILSVPERGVPRSKLPEPWGFADAAAAVRSRSLRLRPRLLTAVGHCVYVRRSALELVGDFDLAFSPGYGEEVDFSQRCLRQGLLHVAADEVLVFHHGGGSFSRDGSPDPVQAEHEVMLVSRYPYYHDAVRASEDDLVGPLPRALAAARRTLTGLGVVIDGRMIGAPHGGKDVLELVGALARAGDARLTVLAPSDHAWEGRDGVEVVPLAAGEPPPRLARADIVHLPCLPGSEEDLRLAAELGGRLIITHHDLVAYHNPSYSPSFATWERHRNLTRTALGSADRVCFPNEHARSDALAEGLLDADRGSVVPHGIDRPGNVVPRAPQAAERLPREAELMLLIGSDRRHENRVFALRVLEELQRRHDWPGILVLAGARVTDGSSAAEENELLAASPRLAEAVFDVGEASEAERAWMLQRASLLIYPPVRGGSGRLPFAAATHSVPCLWSQESWLGEVVPADVGIVAWDPAATADAALTLIRDDDARERNVSALRAAASKLTWQATAERMLEVYYATCEVRPVRRTVLEGTSGNTDEPGLPATRIHLSEDAIRLIGPGGVLGAGIERPLLALATHPRLGRPVFRALEVGYRASHWLAQRRGR